MSYSIILNNYGKNAKYSVKSVIEKAGHNLSILEFIKPHKNSSGKTGKWQLKINCKSCKKDYFTDLYSFMDGGKRCCESIKNKDDTLRKIFAYTPDEISTMTKNISEEYTCINPEVYKNCKTKLDFKHDKCATVTTMAWSKYKSGQRCKQCTKTRVSIVTENFKDILDHFKISYETEKTYPDCKNILPLPFDFYIKEPEILIEIDGEQHRRASHGEDALKKQKHNDEIKNKFAKKNNFKFAFRRVEHNGWNDKVFQELLDIINGILKKSYTIADTENIIWSTALERRKKRIEDERPGYKLLSKIFKGVDNYHDFRHEKCGNEFKGIYDSLRRGDKSCPKCSKENNIEKAWRKTNKALEEKTKKRYSLNPEHKERINGKWYTQCNFCNRSDWWNIQNITRLNKKGKAKGGCNCLTIKKNNQIWWENYNNIKRLFDKEKTLTNNKNLYQWLQKQLKDLNNNKINDEKKSAIIQLLELKERVYSKKILPFDEAKSFVKDLKLNNGQEYLDWYEGKLSHLKNKPDGIPKFPAQVYTEYVGINNWLDNGKADKRFNKDGWREFNEARKFVHSLQLKNIYEWKLFCDGTFNRLQDTTLPHDIPKDPSHTYTNKGWEGIKDWLGTKV